MATLYLASGSPRRRELLTQIGVPFLTQIAPIDENALPGESPLAYVERLARAKGHAGLAALADADGAVVLGADTAVVLDGRILGKPRDRADALATLQALSGRSHQVLTAVALVSRERQASPDSGTPWLAPGGNTRPDTPSPVPGPTSAIALPSTAAPPPTWRSCAGASVGKAKASAVKSLMTTRRCRPSDALSALCEKHQLWLVMRTSSPVTGLAMPKAASRGVGMLTSAR